MSILNSILGEANKKSNTQDKYKNVAEITITLREEKTGIRYWKANVIKSIKFIMNLEDFDEGYLEFILEDELPILLKTQTKQAFKRQLIDTLKSYCEETKPLPKKDNMFLAMRDDLKVRAYIKQYVYGEPDEDINSDIISGLGDLCKKV